MAASNTFASLFEPKRSIVVRTEDGREQKYLYLPETMADWPWPRKINPYYEEVTAESNAWFKTFKPFTPESQYAYDKCDFGRLASLAYPDALRTGVDLMNVFFVVDEYTDVEPAPVVREMIGIVIDALHNPDKPRPEGEIMLGEVTRQFWARGRTTATPEAAKHFVEAFTDYLNSVIVQAEDRDNDTIRTIDSYLETRRQNIGARPSYVPGELHLSIPDEAFYHPVIKELEYLCADLIILDNDIASYNKEQATGDDRHNILTIAMHQFNTDFDSAMDWVANYHKEVEMRFLDALKRVPSWGPEVDKQVAVYIEHLANWPRCNDCWNFESGRYFGSRGREYQKTRLVPMLPKRPQNPNLRRENVEVPLVDKIELEMPVSPAVAVTV
ncbi:terpenoid synthase [Lentinus tigrinus ALCF2SS1-7]|uniref:Terpene synthase n=1 Tax=Lentinus tigrinus ALCF2SS1-6 TaxID=1328759 RepID=A0A5C2SVQ7_9APHY|nr:terpenoid synthase [Lentinus tigrinus ALCF2SS1-6]RPD81423.1 terpenoid synthase [Lentinus tigrinus ALCF2SS1-7]